MNKFYAWLYHKCVNAADHLGRDRPVVVAVNEAKGPSSDGMTIKVWTATGGHIVEFRKYDHMKDRNDNRMYIISADQNFSESLTKIISMEMLR